MGQTPERRHETIHSVRNNNSKIKKATTRNTISVRAFFSEYLIELFRHTHCKTMACCMTSWFCGKHKVQLQQVQLKFKNLFLLNLHCRSHDRDRDYLPSTAEEIEVTFDEDERFIVRRNRPWVRR